MNKEANRTVLKTCKVCLYNGYKMNTVLETIEIKLPLKAEYVSIGRLVASGVCNRIGFDIETIEDIKVAISEVCNKLVSKSSQITDNYKIVFYVYNNQIKVEFFSDDPSLKCIFDHENDKFAVHIINALMDSVELCTTNNYILSMSKVLEENI